MRSTSAILASAALLCQGAAAVKAGGNVQVYLMMGQSNMLGEGNIGPVTTNGSLEFAVKTEGLYPYLIDSNGNWTVSENVRYVFTMGSGGPGPGKLEHNEFLTVTGKNLGPEIGIGHSDFAKTNPTMLLKSCIGNRALGWDLLPPGSVSFDCDRYDSKTQKNVTYTYAGYHQSPASWIKGTTPTPITWEAGIQWDGDVSREHTVLDNLTTYYPGAAGYEVAGIFWWQGDRDSRDMCLADRYELNLVNFIKQIRAEFKAPNAKFVTASLGQTVKGSTDGGGQILDAMLNVGCNTGSNCKYPEFKGNVAAVYSHPYSKGGSSGGHYGKNAETYMNVGQAMGAAMSELMNA